MNPTVEYEQIDLRKVLAEIDKLRAETLKMQSDTKTQIDEREKLRAETLKIQSDAKTQIDEREKLRAEARKMQTESKWHPVWVAAALLAAGAALAKLFLS